MDPTFISSFDSHPVDGGGSRYTTRVPYVGVFNITIESVTDGYTVTVRDPTTAWELTETVRGTLDEAATQAQAMADGHALFLDNAAILPEPSHPPGSSPAGPVA